MSSRSPLVTLLALVVSAAGGVGIGFAAYRFEPRLLGAQVVEGASALEPAESEPEAPAPTASASAPSPPTASASASAAPAVKVEEARQCLRAQFPDDSFSDQSAASLDFVCAEESGLKLAEQLKKALVNAGDAKPSGGMKEWSVLGFYSLAAGAVIRGRCCPASAPLTMPATPTPCESITDAMASLATIAAKRGKKPEAIAALAGFEKSVRCILKTQQGKVFGDYGELRGGEATTFEKTLNRALK